MVLRLPQGHLFLQQTLEQTLITDSDGDGLNDGVETTTGTFVSTTDTGSIMQIFDGDSVSDGNEVSNGTNPNVDETVDPQFQVIRGSYTWAEATSDAAARGGRLAVLNTQEKIDIATALARSDTSPSLHGRNLLIGLKRSYSDNNFYWNTGEPLGTQNWDLNEPGDSEEAVVIALDGGSGDGRWHDVPLTSSYDYLLEIIPQDTDGDGLLDSVESNTGTFVSVTDTGTDPNNADSDGDGLSDGVETNTGVYVSGSDC